MAGKSKKDRIITMIDAVMKFVAGDYSIKLDVSGKNDELDLLAEAINKMPSPLKTPSGLNQVEQTQRMSQRKQAEEGLCLSEERYRGILDSIEEGYLEIDLKGKALFFNEAECRMLGYDHDEMIGMHYRRYSSSETAQQMFEVFHRIYETGIPERMIDYKVIKKDGSIRIHELSAALLRGSSGNPVGFRTLARDVTERRKAEGDLRKREERYRNILDSMEEAYFEVDLRGNLTFFNTTAVKRLGYTNEEVMGMSFRKFVDKENGEKVFVAFQHVFNTGETINVLDWDVINKYGEKIAVEASVILLRDDQGNPAGFRGVVRDVTQRKQAEQALRESEEKYRTILENMVESYFELDLMGNYTFFNESLCKDQGYSRQELMGMNYRVYTSPEAAKRIYRFFNEIYRTGKPQYVVDHEIIRKDGSKRIIEMSISLMRSLSGEPMGFWGVGRDVTERIKAEKAIEESEIRYRMIAENMRDAIYTMDLGMHYTYMSPSIARITGYTAEETQIMSLKEQLTPASYALVEQALSEELTRETSEEPIEWDRSITLELEVIHKDGGTVWIEVTATFNRDETGHATEIMGVARDITERKRAQEEKSKLEGQLLQAQKMESIGRLAGGVAHDFNNMLGVILGYAELIKHRLPAEDPLLQDIVQIERAAGRSKDITAQLLAFSRKQIIETRLMDLNDLIESDQNTFARLIGEDIDLRFYPGEDLWKIKADPSQIEQILVNLVVNARDAMPSGGKLTIETANIHLDEAYCRDHLGFTPGYYVLLGVSDDGAGMDRETLKYIFEPFFTTKEIGKGTGLGLAMVYGVVKQNDGFINVYSEPGQGTTFKIYLARSMEGVEIPEQDNEAQVAFGSGRVLLVEDDEMVRNMTTEMLETIGYTVLTTGNPLDALALCEMRDNRIDLVITDVVMPGMSGRELRDRIKALLPDMKILFMSGYTANVIVHHGVLENGVHFLQKPFSMNDLALKVREAIRGI
jgi:two-component system, cell cycle sensor histidine kinase and response regulator CckA